MPYKKQEDKRNYYREKETERRLWLDTYKTERGCENCGYNKHPRALGFDHIDPNTKSKKYSSKQLVRWNNQLLLEELAKCRVLCHNCHAIHTFENGQYYIKQ